jgi:ABC-2 type transport system permease protein
MTTVLARKTLRDYRRALIGWTIGIGLFMAMYLPFYSQFAENESALEFMESMPEGFNTAMGFDDYLTPAGYVESMVYNLYIPLMLIFCAALLANRAITGPEENNSLETLIALPFSRRQFVLGRFGALALGIVGVGVVQWVLVVLLTTATDIDVGAGGLFAASLGLTLLGLLFGTLGLAVGAATGRRATLLTVTGGAAVLTYAINAFHTQAEALEPLRWLSPFYYYLGGDPLREGLPVGYYLVLAAVTVVLLAVALVTFDRRDVGT